MEKVWVAPKSPYGGHAMTHNMKGDYQYWCPEEQAMQYEIEVYAAQAIRAVLVSHALCTMDEAEPIDEIL